MIRAHDPAIVIPEIEMLRGTDSWPSIAARVGFTDPRALARQLIRWGRADLAAPFGRVMSSVEGEEAYQ